jgi:septal ring factor EnvC (AmiA/AmiB activator)
MCRRGLALLFMLAAMPAWTQDADTAARGAQEREARTKLEAVRDEIRAVTARQRETEGERDHALEELHALERSISATASEVAALDARLAQQQAGLDRLGRRRDELVARLRSQREALAALLRSAYALGRDEELRLLLQQDDVASLARVLACHRYFQRARVARIDALQAELAELAKVEDGLRSGAAEIETTRARRAEEGARLESGRAEHAETVARLESALDEQRARIAALGKDEKALGALLERLRDVFADIPPTLVGDEPFAALRGRLSWPVSGRLLRGFGAAGDGGRSGVGWLIAAANGTPVRAIARGRVAFADWFRGYGLLLIVDHGDGSLSLYGNNETLLKDVGDWVDAGEAIASSGNSGGRKAPSVYFVLRQQGRAIDPRGWLAAAAKPK